MKSMIGAVAIVMLAGVASAQSLPGMPQAGSQPAAISGSGSSGASAPGGLAMPGSSPKSESPIDKAKTEIECKIPTNAAKPECLELMLKK